METYPKGDQGSPCPDYHQYDREWQESMPGLGNYPARPPAAAAPLENLPGARPDPCCMGTMAKQSLDVILGFLQEECRQRQAYLTRADYTCRQDRRELLQRMAEKSRDHIRRLMAACYLITGRCSRPVARPNALAEVGWCPQLREFYHDEVCDSFNYRRAAKEAADPCVAGLFRELAEESEAQAAELFQELSRQMCRRGR